MNRHLYDLYTHDSEKQACCLEGLCFLLTNCVMCQEIERYAYYTITSVHNVYHLAPRFYICETQGNYWRIYQCYYKNRIKPNVYFVYNTISLGNFSVIFVWLNSKKKQTYNSLIDVYTLYRCIYICSFV